LPAHSTTELVSVEAPWRVIFKPDRDAPPSITLETLSSWSENSDTGVKYFSGTATYTKSIDLPAEWFRHRGSFWLDLGSVKNLAEVTVNGKSLGVVWHAPFRVDVTQGLRPGLNQLTIKVTNSWVNRLIGDQQPGAKKFTFTTFQPYRADSPLQPSGLLGPVRIIAVSQKSPDIESESNTRR
jgi:hypothetical protein